MPTTKLVILGLAGLAAMGLGVNNYMKAPWNEAAGDQSAASANKLGYLSPKDLPDSVTLLPPPPAPGSVEMKSDEDAREASLQLHGTARYALAAADSVRDHSTTVKAFSCAFGTAISSERTPTLYLLLSRVHLDVRAASYRAKSHYRRPRPYVVHRARTCHLDDEEMIHDDGSYPSARGAVGWAYALVLAEMRPDRADGILNRGRDFGHSRVVCDQEWQSDVDAGRVIATATLARLNATAEFKDDMEAARREVAAELEAGVKPSADCGVERAALASRQAPGPQRDIAK
jgi:acid phosphatase (class A)